MTTSVHIAYDDVALSLIPPTAQIIWVYRDGRFANEQQARRAFPHAEIKTLTTQGEAGTDGADCEPGDLSPQREAAWARGEIHAGRPHPWLYANRDQMPAVIKACNAIGVHRDEVLIWSAHYTGKEHICGPSTCGADFQANGTQFTDRAEGRSLDESVFDDAILPAVHAKGLALAGVELNLATGAWTVRPQASDQKITWSPRDVAASAEVQVYIGGPHKGRWRVKGLPLDAKPLGG